MFFDVSLEEFDQLYVKTEGSGLSKDNNYWAIDFVRQCEGVSNHTFLPYLIKEKTAGIHWCDYVVPRSGYSSREFVTNLTKATSGFQQTLEGRYNILKNFLITSKDKHTAYFQFEWDSPVSLVDVPMNFSVLCRDTSDLSEIDNFQTVILDKCKLWPNKYCGILNLRGNDLECELSLPDEVRNASIKFTNKEEAPWRPFLYYGFYSNESSVSVRWNPPTVTNGLLKSYLISFVDLSQYQKEVERYNFKYFPENDDEVTLQGKFTFYPKPCTLYFFQVRGVNQYGAGFADTELLKTPPRFPDHLKFDIVARLPSKTYISVSNMTRNEFCNDKNDKDYLTFILVILFDDEITLNTSVASRYLKNKYDISFKDSSNFRVVNEIELSLMSTTNDTIEFTIGDGRRTKSQFIGGEVINNSPLESNKTYKGAFVVLNSLKSRSRYHIYRFEITRYAEEENRIENCFFLEVIASLVFFFILGGILVSICICLKRKGTNEEFKHMSTVDFVRFNDQSHQIMFSYNNDDKQTLFSSAITQALSSHTKNDSITNYPLMKPVKINEFEKYITRSLANQEFNTQFESLTGGFMKPCKVGQMDLNKPKNRYNNIIPYDHNRVKLLTKQNSDYINASFIKGFNGVKTYIATQGPRSMTINDFWQMIWQENVKNIVMLVSLEEQGQKKVEKYWPSYNQDFQFGKIHVFYHSSDLYADYEIRIFRLVCDGSERKVVQYHFLGWPDQGAPVHFQSLVPFMRRILEITSKAPIVVHCCSGIAATGVLILCDICLRAAAESGIVDILGVSLQLREQRVNMIDNLLQYKLAHLMIMECLVGIQTSIACNDELERFLTKLTGQDELRLQMRYLDETSWQNKVLLCRDDNMQTYTVFPEKNKIPDVFPDSFGAVHLTSYPTSDESSAYINAVKVDAYQNPEKYIVTQQPLPNTLNDFWRMIIVNNIEVIINLNEVDLKDKNSCFFWPTHENLKMSPVDFIILKHTSTVDQDFYQKISILIFVEGNESKVMKVDILSFKEWKSKSPTPSNLRNFLLFHGLAEKASRHQIKSVITCYDGVTASGIYVAASYLIEKIKLEKAFDVCEAVKIIRMNRIQFISQEVQLALLYEIAVMYIKGFQDYANFSRGHSNSNIYDYID